MAETAQGQTAQSVRCAVDEGGYPGVWVVYDSAHTYLADTICATEADAIALGSSNVAFWRFGEDIDTAVNRTIRQAIADQQASQAQQNLNHPDSTPTGDPQ